MFYIFFYFRHVSKYEIHIINSFVWFFTGERVDPPKDPTIDDENFEDKKIDDNKIDENHNNNIDGGNANQPQPMDIAVQVAPAQNDPDGKCLGLLTISF